MTPTPLTVAHRGASGVAPEDTFASFNRAVAGGFPNIELCPDRVRAWFESAIPAHSRSKSALRVSP